MRIVLTFIFLTWGILAYAQQFGGNPPSVKWRQLNTDTARIIYPRGLDSTALQIATTIHTVAENNFLPLGNKVRKINLVLQNRPATSNGYVGLGPFRSEFYTTPSPDNFDLGSQNWATQLSLHEYRHVQQYNNFDNGLSAIVKRVLGQDGYALAIDAAVPNWFFEGDAVFQETTLSKQGRGRIPSFLMAYPTLWEGRKSYSWMKLRNGSYKDYTPDHYALGYLLVNYGTEKYGVDFWKKITHDASAYKGLFYPMQKAIKKYSGLRYKDFTDQAFNYYKNLYGLNEKPTDSILNKNAVFPTNTKTTTNYYYPFQIGEDSLLYLKSSYNKRPAFYIKNKNGEYLLRYRDISIEQQFSYRNGKIVYAAYETNPRWKWESYSVIKILDINSLEQRSLGHRVRYYSPDISADGKWVIANSVEANGTSSLVILNAENGAIKNKIASDTITYFANPKFINDSTALAVLRYTDAQTAIGMIHLYSSSIEKLTPPSFTLIGQLNVYKDTVYFAASQHLKDDIFRFDLKNQSLFKLNTIGVGSYFPSGGEGKINWSTFTADGYQLQQSDAENTQWQPASMEDFTHTDAGIITNIVKNNDTTAQLQRRHTAQPYAKLTRPINFYTWRPNYTDPEFSITAYGNNILNTVQTQLYYIYNENNKTHATGGNITYAGLFPYITLGSEYIFNNKITASKKIKEWNEWDTYLGVNIPLTWTSNRTVKSFNIASTYYYRQDYNNGAYRDSFSTINLSYLAHRISWGQQIASTVQDIYPRFGYNTTAQFRHTLDTYKSWQGIASANLYLPGVVRAHSLVFSGAVQYSGTANRIFSNRLHYARGYGLIDSAGVWTASANYHFPIIYPDWGFANIFYLQRVRGNLFYDYTHTFNKKEGATTQMKSLGAEIYFDTQWWNQHPLTFGFRVGRLLNPAKNTQPVFFEFMLPTNLIPR